MDRVLIGISGEEHLRILAYFQNEYQSIAWGYVTSYQTSNETILKTNYGGFIQFVL